jgi:ATP-dependent Clp protease adaptor protein ClpS
MLQGMARWRIRLSCLSLTHPAPLHILKKIFPCGTERDAAPEKGRFVTHAPGVLPESDVRSDEEIREPKQYRVVLHNDDYTTMDFVVEILVAVFHKPIVEATKIMLDVHKKGKGICGVYTYDIAATKVAQVHQMAIMREFPLKCSLEEA